MATSQYCRYPNNSVVTVSTPSVGAVGSPVPASADQVGAKDTSGNLAPLSLDSAGNLKVTFASSPNSNGSFSGAGISVATTLAAPANAIGFLLEADSANTDFMRWCDSNTTASATVGMKLEAGRDTGYLPMAKSISICPNSGTQSYTIQWVLSS